MQVLMLGWEFAPFLSGGLGRACEKIVTGLVGLGHSVDFAVPFKAKLPKSDRDDTCFERGGFRLIGVNKSGGARFFELKKSIVSSAVNLKTAHAQKLDIPLPYSASPSSELASAGNPYAGDLFNSIENYTDRVFTMFKEKKYDVIHAHDWLTFPAAELLSKKLGISFVAHFHSLESDRNPNGFNPIVEAIERKTVQSADHIMVVSDFTRRRLLAQYGETSKPISVIHNGTNTFSFHGKEKSNSRGKRILFIGRLTKQKGIGQFCSIVQQVLKKVPDARFIVAGEGDLQENLQNEIKALSLQNSVQMVGMLKGAQVSKAYQEADVFMMPSLSEPFGLVATEATEHGVPGVLSTSSGVVEILPRAFRADPRDPVRFANMLVFLLQNRELANDVVKQSQSDMALQTWSKTAELISHVYHQTEFI